jgi:hypothetical protein
MRLALQTTDERSASRKNKRSLAARSFASMWLSAHEMLSLAPILPCFQPGCAAQLPKRAGRSVNVGGGVTGLEKTQLQFVSRSNIFAIVLACYGC